MLIFGNRNVIISKQQCNSNFWMQMQTQTGNMSQTLERQTSVPNRQCKRNPRPSIPLALFVRSADPHVLYRIP